MHQLETFESCRFLVEEMCNKVHVMEPCVDKGGGRHSLNRGDNNIMVSSIGVSEA